MDTPALVKIDQVVLSFLNEKDEGTENYMRYKQIVIEGLTQELGVSHSEGVRVYYGQIDEVNNLYLPADFIKETRIGVIVNGQVYTLTQNPNLAMPSGKQCGVEVVNEALLKKLNIPVALNYAKGGGYNIGEYRVDLTDRVIRFRGNLKGTVAVLEYRSSGVSLDSNTYIPVMVVPVLKEYLEYTLAKRNPDIAENKILRYRIQFLNVKTTYIKRKNPFNYHDILDVIDKGRSQGIK